MDNNFNTIKWTCTVGVNEGYELDNQIEVPIEKVADIYMEISEDIFKETGVYISAVITSSRVLYNREWGCTAAGEYAYTLSGSCNPEFADKEEYLRALKLLSERLKDRLAQSTLLMEITPAHLDYYRK